MFSLSNLNSAPPSAHPDLLWQRYLAPDFVRQVKSPPLTLADWHRVASFQPGDFYAAVYGRWKQTLEGRPHPILYEAKVEGRLLTGSGLAGVFETAMLLHPVYGVPYVAGSTVRGTLRAALAASYPAEAEKLFGSAPRETGAESESITAGFVTVHDALWVPKSSRTPLSLDVLTVHHPKYYQGDRAPTDFDQPNPVHFLTARGKFLFALEAPDASWGEYLQKVLMQALRFRGIGAKKAAGYGRFMPPQP